VLAGTQTGREILCASPFLSSTPAMLGTTVSQGSAVLSYGKNIKNDFYS
jgi:hypothetical protein